ncbi:MAG TPA: hypothetical protein VN682_06105 [Terriglobales bacterium]|nr:hypothetical protein [Terriglobales bacterium]
MRFPRIACRFLLYMAASLIFSVLAHAQDSVPSRVEAGAAFTSVHNLNVGGSIGPAAEGDINLGNHLALDGSFNWLPNSGSQTVNFLIGPKAGIRHGHFGLFAKARPGFISTSHNLQSSTLNVDTGQATARIGRIIERALDLGGVVEYYPSTRWLLRWDMGDTMVSEARTDFSFTGTNPPPNLSVTRGITSHFQFSTSVHYRF